MKFYPYFYSDRMNNPRIQLSIARQNLSSIVGDLEWTDDEFLISNLSSVIERLDFIQRWFAHQNSKTNFSETEDK